MNISLAGIIMVLLCWFVVVMWFKWVKSPQKKDGPEILGMVVLVIIFASFYAMFVDKWLQGFFR